MSIKSSKEPHKTDEAEKTVKPVTSPRSFDSLVEYFAHAKTFGVCEVFITVTANPTTSRDPRADVFHAQIEARIKEPFVTKVRGKEKTNYSERTLTFSDALDLFVVDQIAQPDNFGAMTEKALEPILLAAETAGLTVRRGRL